MAASAEEIVGVIFQGKDEVGVVQSRIEKRLKDLDKSAQRSTSSLRRNFQNAASAVAVLEGPLGGVAGRINAVGAALARTSAGFILFGITTSAILTTIGLSTRQFATYERQMSRLNGTLEATEYQSGLTAAQIDALAISIGRATLTSRQEALDAAAQLTTFATIGSENFERTLKAAQDMAEVFQISLPRSTQLLGRALEDPAENLEVLRRRFPAFTKEVIASIEQLADSGQELAAQDAILDVIESKIGGAAEVSGITAKLDTLGEAVKEIGVKIGAAYSPLVEKAIDKLMTFFQVLNSFSPGQTDLGALGTPALETLRDQLNVDLQQSQDSLVEFEARLKRINEAQGEYTPSVLDVLKKVFQKGQEALNIDTLSEEKAAYSAIALQLREVNDELRKRYFAQRAEGAARGQREAERLAEERALQTQTELYEESVRQSEIITEQAKEQVAAQRRIDTLIKQSIPDQDKVAAIQREITELKEKGARITEDQEAQILKKTLEDSQQVTVKLGEQVSESLTGRLREATLEARDLKDVINDLLDDLALAIANKFIFAPFENATSSFLSGLSLPFGGARATGGSVSTGSAYIVGERGPELFVPGKSGTIVPNSAGDGGGTIVNVINGTGEPTDVRRSTDPSGRELIEVIVGQVRRNIAGGGSIAQSMEARYGLRSQPVMRS